MPDSMKIIWWGLWNFGLTDISITITATHEHHTVVHLRASSSLLKKVGREGEVVMSAKEGGLCLLSACKEFDERLFYLHLWVFTAKVLSCISCRQFITTKRNRAQFLCLPFFTFCKKSRDVLTPFYCFFWSFVPEKAVLSRPFTSTVLFLLAVAHKQNEACFDPYCIAQFCLVLCSVLFSVMFS